jgi:BMFP domain-containing protein YqiC
MPFLQDSREEASLHIKRLIKRILADQGIVTREMFDVQATLLSKARLKLESLEALLESHLKETEVTNTRSQDICHTTDDNSF